METFTTAQEMQAALAAVAKKDQIPVLERFFKTDVGEYAHGDQFIGVKVPQIRAIAKHGELSLEEINILLQSPVHEHRFAGLVLLIKKFLYASKKRSFNEKARKHYFAFYMDALEGGCVNNWDLVDLSAGAILGEYLQDQSRDILDDMVLSDSVWVRRAAMVSTQAYMKNGDASTTLRLARALLHDEEELIQKAVGWMLRTMGHDINRDLLMSFLDVHAHEMPRIMLRYSIEKCSDSERKVYLAKRDEFLNSQE